MRWPVAWRPLQAGPYRQCDDEVVVAVHELAGGGGHELGGQQQGQNLGALTHARGELVDTCCSGGCSALSDVLAWWWTTSAPLQTNFMSVSTVVGLQRVHDGHHQHLDTQLSFMGVETHDAS